MDEPLEEVFKVREVHFKEPHPDPDQAGTAECLLKDVHGVRECERVSPVCLKLSYDVRCITLEVIEEALAEMGFHLDNSLLCKVRRAVFYYTEEVQRANMGCEHGSTTSTRDIFVSRYERLCHGCRDHRPEHWRHYL